MELTVTPRTKSETNKIRREGNIPAILYSKGLKGEEIVVEGGDFKKVLNRLEPGTLSAQIFTLMINGKKRRAIVKDIQYHITTYAVLHIDFEELHEDVPVSLNIPLRCTFSAECLGVKLGGIFRQITRSLRVRCLPKDIPTHFELNVRDLGLGQAMKLEQIALPKGVKAMANLNDVAVVISRR